MIDLSILGSFGGTIKTLEDAAFMRGIVSAAGTQVSGALKNAYPPSKSGPGRYSLRTQRPMGYYQRSVGWWYPVMRRATLGAERIGRLRGTQLAPRQQRGPGEVIGYKLAAGGTSQRFKEQWSMRLEDGGFTAVITNPTTYGPFVMGDELQSALMAALNWPTVRKVVAQEWPNIVRAARAGLKAQLAARGK